VATGGQPTNSSRPIVTAGRSGAGGRGAWFEGGGHDPGVDAEQSGAAAVNSLAGAIIKAVKIDTPSSMLDDAWNV